MNLTAFDLAQRFVGMKEVGGSVSNPQILAMLRLDESWPAGDETPWCSAFVNYIAWLMRLPRSRKLNARSWLEVGASVPLVEARAAFDVVILSRPPSPESGHVGFMAGYEPPNTVLILGGNQGDAVCVAPFSSSRIIGIRRLYATPV
jgi:uncharacterized protein (TIGR02594 family)